MKHAHSGRFKAASYSITTVQVYASTTDYDDGPVEKFYNQLQEVIDKVDKKYIVIKQGGLECQGRHRRINRLEELVRPLLRNSI